MQPLRRHDVRFNKAKKRVERLADRANRIGHGRQRYRHAFQGIPLGLPVQGLVLTELLKHDHRQQARSRPSPRNHMERRRRLRDLLAIPAGELLTHRFDHLPLAGLRLQRAGDVLAELAQAMAPAAFTRRRGIDQYPLARKMVRERRAIGTLARKSNNGCRPGGGLFSGKLILGRAGFQLFEGERKLLDQPRRALRALTVNLMLQLCDAKLLLRDQRHVFRGFRPSDRQFRPQTGDFFGKGGAISIHEAK